MNRKKERFLFFFAISLSLAGIGTILSSPLFLERKTTEQEINDEQVPGIESDLLESTANLGTDDSKLTSAYQQNERTTSRASSAATTISTTLLQGYTKETTTRTTSTMRITESSISSSIFNTTTKAITTSSVAATEPTSSTLLSSTPTSSHVTISTLVTTPLITTTSTSTTTATPTMIQTIKSTPTTPKTTSTTTTRIPSITTTPTSTTPITLPTTTSTTTTPKSTSTTPTPTTTSTTTISTTTATSTTTTPLSCEDFFCKEGGVCLTQNVAEDKCEDLYTGVDCEVPPMFVRQRNPNNSFMKSDFTTALKTCQSQGGYLAFFINEQEFDSYVNFDRERNKQEFIGYFTCDHPKFVNADGKDSRYEKWAAGEPNNNNRIEFCGSLLDKNQMNDVPCDREYEFACRFPRLNTCEDYFCYYGGVCKTSRKPTCDNDHHQSNNDDDCTTTAAPTTAAPTTAAPTSSSTTTTTTTTTTTLTTTTSTTTTTKSTTTTTCNPTIFEKQRDDQRTPIKANYKDATELCRQKGGYVAYFLDQDEFDEFKSLPDRSDQHEYLGYFSCNSPNDFYQANGELAQFTEWNTNEPNNWDGKEFCVELYGKNEGGKMNDKICTEKKEFSCRLPQSC